MRRGRFHRGVFLAALTLSATVHVFVIVPRLLRPLLEREPAPIEVTYVEEPTGGSAVDEPTATDQLNPARAPVERQPQPPEVAKVEPSTREPPEVAKVDPPKPKLAEAKPVPASPSPPPAPMPRMKMVDQDRPEDEPDNPDAHYLAQKNHRAKEETRALDTNLVRELPGPAARPSSPSENQLSEPGDPDHKVAELEDRKGEKNQLVRARPLEGDKGEGKPRKPGKLAMRDLIPAPPRPPLEPREGLELAEEGEGSLPGVRVGERGERAQAQRRGARGGVKLELDADNYDNIVGFATAQKERQRAARGERSHVPGRWDRLQRQLAMARSSLENFIPEVRPGNQTELGTRAHPFAAYIAEMHRQIHKLWAYGFLADLDGKSLANPYNDMALWTQLEIVLRGDGSLEKITIVRTSGISNFDLAALDSVSAASPFPKPPAAIKSANGKVYLDWRFHRDDRQCGTFGVDPHILTTVGENQDHDLSEVGTPTRPPRAPRAGGKRAPAAVPTSSSPTSSSSDGVTIPQAARDAAQGWFASYARGDERWLAGWSATPFTANGTVSARTPVETRQMYAELLREVPGSRRLEGMDVYTPAQMRAHRGGLPPGGEGESDMLFAVGKSAGEEIVLLLKQSDRGWRVCGLAR